MLNLMDVFICLSWNRKTFLGEFGPKKSKLFIFYHGVSRLHIETDVDTVHLE